MHEDGLKLIKRGLFEHGEHGLVVVVVEEPHLQAAFFSVSKAEMA